MANTNPKLIWDQIGQKLWETGVDRTVLFPMTAQGGYGKGVAWSGITAINESPSGAEPTKIYADNIVYGVVMSPEEDALTIEAFTYPDEYAECIGEAEVGEGVVIKQQTHKHFGLAYRTMIGNDTVGTEHGYKIHIFWDCVAGASEDSNSTINAKLTQIENLLYGTAGEGQSQGTDSSLPTFDQIKDILDAV